MADFWLGAAAASFQEVLRREKEEGRPAARERLGILRDSYLALRQAGRDRPLAELSGDESVPLARSKGAWVLWMLHQTVGPLTFQALWPGPEDALLTTESLKRKLSEIGHHDAMGESVTWDAFLDFWVYSAGLPQYRLLGARRKGTAGNYAVTLKIANQGVGAIPAPVVVQTEEGARHEFSLAVPGGKTSEVTLTMVTRPVAAAVDPEGDLLQPEPSGGWQPVKSRWFERR
jgi:hypothetical protein